MTADSLLALERMQAWRRALQVGATALSAALLLALLWQWSQQQVGVRRDSPRFTALVPVQPPEPVKPPEPERPPKPEPKPEPTPRQPPRPRLSPAPPKPVQAPQSEASPGQGPGAEASDAMQIDGQAQAGGDAFNIGAGSGGGMSGSGSGLGGVGNASYGRYLAYALQQAVSRDPVTRRLLFRIQVDIWIDPAGRLTRVELVRGSGDERTDRAVLAALRATPQIDQPPPASLRFPARVSVLGRRT